MSSSSNLSFQTVWTIVFSRFDLPRDLFRRWHRPSLRPVHSIQHDVLRPVRFLFRPVYSATRTHLPDSSDDRLRLPVRRAQHPRCPCARSSSHPMGSDQRDHRHRDGKRPDVLGGQFRWLRQGVEGRSRGESLGGIGRIGRSSRSSRWVCRGRWERLVCWLGR